jgi:hypothetical protein
MDYADNQENVTGLGGRRDFSHSLSSALVKIDHNLRTPSSSGPVEHLEVNISVGARLFRCAVKTFLSLISPLNSEIAAAIDAKAAAVSAAAITVRFFKR